jgi:hypothetical protein
MEPTGLEFVLLLPFMLFAIIFSIGAIAMAFWIWMLIDCATKETTDGNEKIVWILIIILTNILGALIYFFARKLPRNTKLSNKPIEPTR